MKLAIQSLYSNFKKVPNWVDYVYVGLGALATSVFALFSFFYSDDFWHLLVNSGKFTTGYNYFGLDVQSVSNVALYRPTTNLFFGGLEKVFGLNPLPFHLVQVILFVATAVLVRYFTMLLTGDRKVANLATLIFIILPARVEPSQWLANICDTFLVFFSVLSLSLFIKFLKQLKSRNSLLLFVGSIFSFGAALISKEPAVIIPFIVGLYVLFFYQKSFKAYFWTGIYALPLIPYFVMRSIYTKLYLSKINTGYKAPTLSVVSLKLDLINIKFFFYRTLGIGLDPTHLRLKFFLPLVVLFILIATIIIAWLIRKGVLSWAERKLLLWLTVFYGLTLAPVLNAPNYFDRYLYFGSIALTLMISILGFKIYYALNKKAAKLFLVFSLIILGYWYGQTVSQQILEYQGSVMAKAFVGAIVRVDQTSLIRVLNVPFYYDRTYLPGYKQRALVINRADYVYTLYSGGKYAIDETATIIDSSHSLFNFTQSRNLLKFEATGEGISVVSPFPTPPILTVKSFKNDGLFGELILPYPGPYYIYGEGGLKLLSP